MKQYIFPLCLALLLPVLVSAQEAVVVDITFPVDGPVTFQDDFGDGRYGHTHEGNDLMGEKMTPIVSASDGVVAWAPVTEPYYGYMLSIIGDDGYLYNYIHLNNDTPGTDDGMGGPENAYAAGVYQGARVSRGQLIAWMGDSGNAEDIGSHLHFEIHDQDDIPINPYYSLMAALSSSNFDPDTEAVLTPNINANRGLTSSTASNPPCQSDTLIKSPSSASVYYCGADGKRYAFPNDRVFFSWYNNFDEVTIVSEEELASALLAGNVRYRPGVKLIKIQTDPKVYAVGQGGELRWVGSEQIASQLYGSDWADQVDDVSETLFVDYNIGEPINFIAQ